MGAALPRMLLLLASCALPVIACASPAFARTAATTVDGDAITEDQIKQRTKLDFLSTHKEEARQHVIDELTDDEMKIREAAKCGFNPTDADVGSAFAQMCSRMRVTPEQLIKSLEGQGIGIDTLKQRIKADLARATLTRH
jgi:peptidyl-prolyl cis-trans isomerase SurA